MHHNISEQSNSKLRREIGVLGLSSNIINIMVGAGIFALPGIVAAGLGAESIVAYLFCGALIFLIMLCFAEVGSKVTTTGGAYAYIEVAFGRYAGFLAAMLFIVSSVTSDAAVANALVNVLGSLFPLFKLPVAKYTLFFLVFSGLACINVIGVRQGIGLVKINTIAKLTPLLLLVVVGWKDVTPAYLAWDSIPSIGKIGEVSLILFWAFQGAESGISVSGEVKNPKKTVPTALFISLSFVLMLYILIQVVSQGVLGSELGTVQKSPLAEVGGVVFGPAGFILVTLGAAVSMFGNLSGEILSIPRIVYGAASDKVIPSKWLAKIHPKYATPYIAIIVYTFISFALAVLGGFKVLAVLSSAAMLIIYFGVALALIKLRRSKMQYAGSFRVPGGYTVPVLAGAVIIWLLSNMERQETVGGLLFLLFLSLVYFFIKPVRPTVEKSKGKK